MLLLLSSTLFSWLLHRELGYIFISLGRYGMAPVAIDSVAFIPSRKASSLSYKDGADTVVGLPVPVLHTIEIRA